MWQEKRTNTVSVLALLLSRGVKDAADLEKSMQNIWMGSFRLFVKIARFSLENEVGKDSRGMKGKKQMQNGDTDQDVGHKGPKGQGVRFNSFVLGGKSYASSLIGKHQPNPNRKEVVVSNFAKAYVELHGKTTIGKTKDLWTLRKLDLLLKEAKFGDSNIKYLGGLNVLVVFKINDKADSFRSEAPGFKRFSSVDIWNAQATTFERLAWLNIHGVPLHMSGNETFDSVGRYFGKVIHAPQRQLEDKLLTSDSVGVLTGSGNRIEEIITIVNEGKCFRVWVEEERGDWILDSIDNQDGQPEDDVVSETEKGASGDICGSENLCSMNGYGLKVGRDIVDEVGTEEIGLDRSPEAGLNIGGFCSTVIVDGSDKGCLATPVVSDDGPVKGCSATPVGIPEKVGSDKECPAKPLVCVDGPEIGCPMTPVGIPEEENDFNAIASDEEVNGNMGIDGSVAETAGIGIPRFGSLNVEEEEMEWRGGLSANMKDTFNKPILGFKGNLFSVGPKKVYKNNRKPINKSSSEEETTRFIRPRKRTRQNDPFDLNETIGI
ncbi:hypothetical protein Hdeb2414_s0017g00503391 [Helianthus debilis subsp. tardiflorus]